jgi:hypothetical protein
MASSQGTQPSKMNKKRRPLRSLKPTDRYFLHILCFIFFFSDNNMAEVANKQQTTALFLSAIVTHKKTHRTDKKN